MADERRQNDWLFERMNELDRKLDRMDAARRDDLNGMLSRFMSEVQKMIGRTEDHSGRLIVLETQRDMAHQEAIRRGAWAGILAAAGLEAAVTWAKHFAGWTK